MAEFQEVIRQKNRMCQSVLCRKCDIYLMCGQESGKCPQFMFSNPKKTEETIMSWAAEHPEPVYPTWGEWLNSLHVVGVHAMQAPLQNVYYPIEDTMNTPIPADIAQKLGIEPKEG